MSFRRLIRYTKSIKGLIYSHMAYLRCLILAVDDLDLMVLGMLHQDLLRQ